MAADDTVALGCLDALAEAGVRVPDEIAVVGFDDIPAASLRSVWLHHGEHGGARDGNAAVELVIERIGSGPEPAPVREVLPARLIVARHLRRCTRPPRAIEASPDAALQPVTRSRPARRRSAAIAAPTGGRS